MVEKLSEIRKHKDDPEKKAALIAEFTSKYKAEELSNYKDH
jgi:hypothetical protein